MRHETCIHPCHLRKNGGARSAGLPRLGSPRASEPVPDSARQGGDTMTDETVSATTIINAPAGAIFAVLADPANHVAIDGTGWVRGALDSQRLTAEGQVFRIAMYHPNH